MQRLSFNMIKNETKKAHAKLMLEAGNTLSPLYTIFNECDSLPNDDEDNLENDENVFPDLIQKEVFKETNEDDIGFRVISYF